MTDPLNLTGQMLIAMPGMADPRFAQSVVYVCDHSDKGAMGLIVNKPAADLSFGELLEQLDIEQTDASDGVEVFFGGPVETGRGFVLHSAEYQSDLRTLTVQDGIALTPTMDVLEDIAVGKGPRHVMMMLGYAGWGPGQLEGEIGQNGWLTCDSARDILFKVPSDQMWSGALGRLGINPAALSAEAGSA